LSQLLDDLLSTVNDRNILQVLIGLHWTAVVAEVAGQQRCGPASTQNQPHHPHGKPDVPLAGQLEELSGLELAALVKSGEPPLASLGVAAINALLPHHPEVWLNLNAETVLAEHGIGKKVALIGHFPFVARLRSHVGNLQVLEQHPQPGDLPAEAAAEILPQAEVVAISGTTLINHTIDKLLAFCSAEACIIMLGPSTPLTPVLYDHGIDMLCGSMVKAIAPVMKVVRQGGNFRQVHRAGVDMVTMVRPGYNYDG
jgi:uncharacterized protein (DUF4213/DUF364 family)